MKERKHEIAKIVDKTLAFNRERMSNLSNQWTENYSNKVKY